MLTSLNWLEPGNVFPPLSEKERMETYRNNDLLFRTQHKVAWQDDFDEIARRLRRRGHSVDVILNYQQLLSKKTADFICGETPKLESEQDTDELEKLLSHLGWSVRLYEAFIDVSRFGNAILKFVGKGITAVSPQCWFPVVDPTDLKTIKQHVIAYPIEPNATGKYTKLYAEIHEVGKIETRYYEYDADTSKIGSLLDAPVTASTGMDDFAVQVLTNVTHSGDVFGVDDYSIINSLVAKIMWRLSSADLILDKHSAPTLYGPTQMAEQDPITGLWIVRAGNFFEVDGPDAVKPGYLTWDGNLESNFKEIELLINQLYTLSEMGKAFMEGGGGGEANSGTALKLRMVAPRIKAARLVNLNNGRIKKIIYMLATLNNIRLNYDSLTIHWSDGLPVDEVEQVQTLTTATGGKAIMSQYAAMKRLGLSDEEVEAELEAMREEAASSAPLVLTSVDEDGEP
jgi:hypothetical protein